MRLFVFLVQIRFSSSDLFSCDKNQCSTSMLSDGNCNFSCNILPCNFDSLVNCFLTPSECFEYSDCYSACTSTSCNPADLGNSLCDPSCDSIECGWDLGDCGYCSEGCTTALLSNDVCDPVCDNLACMYDNNACGWCADGCFFEDLWSDKCTYACTDSNCQGYKPNPCYNDCAPGCTSTDLADNYCSDACNNPECLYDNGFCLCSPGCTPEKMAESTCDGENDPCASIYCNFKNGACGTCAMFCVEEMLGDGICNPECYNPQCFYDYMDCGCAPGCSSKYDSTTGWEWDTSGTEACLVPACLYNYG